MSFSTRLVSSKAPVTVESMSLPRPVVELSEVTKSYRSGRRGISALQGIDLRVEAGEWVSVVGPSGCGKSTLLNILAGIDSADAGLVHVAGANLRGMSENALARWRGRGVGIIFQFFQLMPTLTTIENVMLPMDLAGSRVHGERKELRSGRTARALALLNRVGVGHLASSLPSELSGGEQQRVAVARALANDPVLILADEPTGNLDSRNGEIVVDILSELWQAGTTIIMVTHDREVAGQASRMVTMHDGSIVDDRCRNFELPAASG